MVLHFLVKPTVGFVFFPQLRQQVKCLCINYYYCYYHSLHLADKSLLVYFKVSSVNLRKAGLSSNGYKADFVGPITTQVTGVVISADDHPLAHGSEVNCSNLSSTKGST